MLIIFVNSDNLFRLDGLAFATNGSPCNDATVTYALKDLAGVTVASGAMPYIPASSGRYEGIAESTTVLARGETYFIEVTAISGEANGFWRDECVAEFNDGSTP